MHIGLFMTVSLSHTVIKDMILDEYRVTVWPISETEVTKSHALITD